VVDFLVSPGLPWQVSSIAIDGAPPAMAKAMGIKPASDPAVKAKTEAQMIDTTKKGEGKMPAYAAKLSDAEIKGAVDYFRTFAK